MTVKVIPGEFTPFTIAIAILSGVILFYGYVSMFVKERLFLSEAFVALIVGIIAGPLVSNGFNPYSWDSNDTITKELTRCVIAIQVMAVGIELPKHYLKKEWRSMFIFLLPVMIFMWLISGLFIWAFIPPLDYLHALVIAACVCPTDPILANSVVKGRFAEKHVPAHIRNLLSAESGANDGMGFPFLFLALFLINEDSVGSAIGKWVYITCLFQIVLSCVIGAVVGWVACKALQWSEKKHLIDKPSFLSFGIALALFLLSMTGFSGSDDVLACFVAGNAFSWDEWFRKETEEAHFQDVIDMMLNLAVFVYIGTIIPWSEFGNTAIGLEPWRLVVIAILILLFRRLPIVLALKPVIPAVRTYREALFTGWFGPMGVGAVFLSIIAKEELESVYEGKPHPIAIELVEPVVLFIVLASTLVHGTTIPLFKLGKGIRTRTISITSTGSNQVLRLPKIQFGQQLGKNRYHNSSDDDDKRSRHSYHDEVNTMTELQRNTLMNTIQQDRYDHKDISAATVTPAHEVIHMRTHSAPNIHDSSPSSSNHSQQQHQHQQDDDDFDDEDFLPGGDDEELDIDHSQNNITTTTTSTPVPESQSIRFLEPVNPRISTSGDKANHHQHTSSISNMEKNEISASSFRNWLNRHSHNKSSNNNNNNNSNNNNKDSDQDVTNINVMDLSSTPIQQQQHDDGAKGLKQLFNNNSQQHKHALPERRPSEEFLVTSHRVKVWDEMDNIIIEDSEGQSEPITIVKSKEMNNNQWRHDVQNAILSLEKVIEKDEIERKKELEEKK